MLPKCHYSYGLGPGLYFPDLRVVCADGEMSAHRGVLCAHSRMLNAAFHELEPGDEGGDYTLIIPDTPLKQMQQLADVLYGRIESSTEVSKSLLTTLNISAMLYTPVSSASHTKSAVQEAVEEVGAVEQEAAAEAVASVKVAGRITDDHPEAEVAADEDGGTAEDLSGPDPDSPRCSGTEEVKAASRLSNKRSKEFECEMCGRLFRYKSNLNKHKRRSMCKRRLVSKSPRSTSPRSRPNSAASDPSSGSGASKEDCRTGTKFKCSKCGEPFSTMLLAQEHIKDCGNEVYQCGECSLILNDFEAMQEHVRGHPDDTGDAGQTDDVPECQGDQSYYVPEGQDDQPEDVPECQDDQSYDVPESDDGGEMAESGGDIDVETAVLSADFFIEDGPTSLEAGEPVLMRSDDKSSTNSERLSGNFAVLEDEEVEVEEDVDGLLGGDEEVNVESDVEGEVVTEEIIEEDPYSIIILNDDKDSGKTVEADIETTEVVIQAQDSEEEDENTVILLQQGEEVKNHFCHVCKNGFGKVEQLTAHLSSHPVCDLCTLRSLNEEAHRIHAYSHPMCEMCGRVVVSASVLTEHMKIHMKPPPAERYVAGDILVSTYQSKEVRDAIDSITDVLGNKTSTGSLPASPSKQLSSGAVHRCKLCYRGFSTEEILNIHVLGVHGNIRTTIDNPDFEISVLDSGFPCQFCSAELESLELLNQHTLVNHEALLNVLSEPKSEDGLLADGVMVDVDGGLPDPTHGAHLLADQVAVQERAETFRCAYCQTGFDQLKELGKHVQQQHRPSLGDFKPSVCVYCRTTFVSPLTLKKHYAAKHEGIAPRYECPECGKEMTNAHILVSHLLRHSDEKPFQCGLCHRAFKVKSSLKSHYKKCSGAAMLSPSPPLLGVSMSPETNQLVWSSQSCSTEFSNQHRFATHTCKLVAKKRKVAAQHTLAKWPTKKSSLASKLKKVGGCRCNICGKKFADKWKLQRHIKIHSVKNILEKVTQKGTEEEKSGVNKGSVVGKRSVKRKMIFADDFVPLSDTESEEEFKAEVEQWDSEDTEEDEDEMRALREEEEKEDESSVEEEKEDADEDVQGKVLQSSPWMKYKAKGVRKFVCVECGKGYFRKIHLNEHVIRAHTKDFPFRCPHCDRGFLRTYQMTDHKCSAEAANEKATEEKVANEKAANEKLANEKATKKKADKKKTTKEKAAKENADNEKESKETTDAKSESSQQTVRCEFCHVAVRNMHAYSQHFSCGKGKECGALKKQYFTKVSSDGSLIFKKRQGGEPLTDEEMLELTRMRKKLKAEARKRQNGTESDTKPKKRVKEDKMINAPKLVLKRVWADSAGMYAGGGQADFTGGGQGDSDGLYACSTCEFSTNIGQMFNIHVNSIEHLRRTNPQLAPVEQEQEQEQSKQPTAPKEEEENKVGTVTAVEESKTSRSGRKIIVKKLPDDFLADGIKRKIDDLSASSPKKVRLEGSSPAKKAALESSSPHKKTHQPSPPVITAEELPKTCQICTKNFLSNQSLFLHLLEHVPEHILSGLPPGNHVWCPHCPGPIPANQVDEHLNERHSDLSDDLDPDQFDGIKINQVSRGAYDPDDTDTDDLELNQFLVESQRRSIVPCRPCFVLLQRLDYKLYCSPT